MYNLWTRNKHVSIESLDGHLRITTVVQEQYFSARVALLLRASDLRIVSVEAEMPRPIHEECLGALPVVRKVVGDRVSEGLTKRVDALIGGRHGCTHMANLVLESCHAAAIGYRQVKMAEVLNAGLKSDDFYRAFLASRPKELLNSCVAFKEAGSLVQRLRTPPEGQPVREMAPAQRIVAGTGGLPVLSFARNKLVGVGRLHRDLFLASGILEDNAHGMRVEVEVSFPDLTICAVRGQMPRTPNEECQQAVGALKRAVGLGLRPGLTAAVDEEVGRNGCPHLANLMLEACHGVIQGTLGAAIANCRAEDPGVGWDQIRVRWLEGMPLLHGSCLAYQKDGALWRQLGLAVPVQ